MDDEIDLDYELTVESTDIAEIEPAAAATAIPATNELTIEQLPPASTVESKIECCDKASSRTRTRIRYRSSSSASLSSNTSNRSRSRSPSHRRRYVSSSSAAAAATTAAAFRRHHHSIGSKNRIERRFQHAKRFGIQPPPEDLSITRDELFDLYESMGVDVQDDRIRLRSVYVRGVDDLSEFQIEKIFAEFSPRAVEMIDDVSCNVIWNDEYVVGKMMLEMTKPLKRVRRGRLIEEGEVAEGSDEEEGEMKEEHGDDVTIRTNPETTVQQSEAAKIRDNFIEVDVDQVEVPPGKWRAITKHVGQTRLIILRFSTREDLRKGRAGLLERHRQSELKDTVDKDGFTYKWTNRKARIRPGLNIFNNDGDELEWDYEHDIRFYVDLDKPEKNPLTASGSPLKKPTSSLQSEGPAEEGLESILGKRVSTVKCKGRGSKRFKAVVDGDDEQGSMAADEEERSRMERQKHMDQEDVEEHTDSDFSSDDRDPSPTPQPWDTKHTSVRLRITKPGLSIRRRRY